VVLGVNAATVVKIWLVISTLVDASMLGFAFGWRDNSNKTAVQITYITDFPTLRFFCWWCDWVAPFGNSVLIGRCNVVDEQANLPTGSDLFGIIWPDCQPSHSGGCDASNSQRCATCFHFGIKAIFMKNRRFKVRADS